MGAQQSISLLTALQIGDQLQVCLQLMYTHHNLSGDQRSRCEIRFHLHAIDVTYSYSKHTQWGNNNTTALTNSIEFYKIRNCPESPEVAHLPPSPKRTSIEGTAIYTHHCVTATTTSASAIEEPEVTTAWCHPFVFNAASCFWIFGASKELRPCLFWASDFILYQVSNEDQRWEEDDYTAPCS